MLARQQAESAALAKFAKQHDTAIIADEVFFDYSLESETPSPAANQELKGASHAAEWSWGLLPDESFK